MFFGASCNGLEATTTDPCEGAIVNELYILSSLNDEIKDINEKDFKCLLYPTNSLNCSWSFQSLEKEAEVSVYTRICEHNRTAETQVSGGKEGSSKILIQRDKDLYVLLLFNVSLRDRWTVYSYKYDTTPLEVLSPPPNITTSFTDSGLLVTWGLPSCRTYCAPRCLEYDLSLGDQASSIVLKESLSYTEPNVDLSRSYTVKLRTRIGHTCSGSQHWSDWSQPVTIQAKHSTFKLNLLVIVAISLGIPMILLALLLLVRYQSVSKLLFPPIPCPPPKYLHILENNDTFLYPDLTAKCEEITVFDYIEEEKTHKSESF